MRELFELSTNLELTDTEVRTPPALVEEMLDRLPAAVWSDPNARFLDPCAGTGTFVLSIVGRLMRGLGNAFPDRSERAAHILANQVWACDVCPLQFSFLQSGLRKLGVEHLARNLYNCNVLEQEFDMKFDVIVGNPPYNENSSSDKHNTKQKGSKNLWIDFFLKSKSMLKSDDSLICFVTPNHWIRDTNPVKNIMMQGCFVWAEISDIKQYFRKIGSTFTAWIWKKNKNEHNIFCNKKSIDINQNLIPQIADADENDWNFLCQDFGRKPVNWTRTNSTSKMKVPCIVVERASPMKRIYNWDGLQIPRGDWYFYNCHSNEQLNDILDFLKSVDGQRIISLVRSGTAITHVINKVPCEKL